MTCLREYIYHIFSDFGSFLKGRNIINTGIAFVIALQVNKFFLDLVDIIVNPIASKLIDKELNKQETKVLNINFKTGALLLSLINFSIILIFIYNVFKLSESAPTILERVYSGISGSIKKIF
jgi:large-conductance mechanosensitive channel